MKTITINPDTLEQVVAKPKDGSPTHVEALIDAKYEERLRREGIERQGLVFVGNRDGSDLYLDIKEERPSPQPYEVSV